MPASVDSIQKVEEWFEKNATTPYWSIYYTHNTNLKSANVAARQKENVSQDESLEFLKTEIERLRTAGSKIQIFSQNAPSGQTGSNGGIKLYLTYPKDAVTSVSGIGSLQMQMAGVGSIGELVQKEISTALKIERLERERDEALQAANEVANPDYVSKAFQFATEDPEGAAQILQTGIGAIAAIFGMLRGVPMSPHVSGTPPTTTVVHETEEANQEAEEVINNALDRIEKHFPDLPNFMNNLADYIEKNPTLAKSIFNNITK